MPDRYHFSYGVHSVYPRVVELVERFRIAEAQVVLDVGCGFGAIAEPIAELGLVYCGVDVDTDALEDLEARGFETVHADLSDADAGLDLVRKQLADRGLATITSIDLLEHVTNGGAILRNLHDLSLSQGGVPLVLAVPNITHFDVAAKLLIGRFDYTPTGLLDDTHVAYFSPGRLHEVTSRSGWSEVGRNDFELADSDQHFPAEVAVLADGTPLHRLLFQIRDQAMEGAIVNEFVRAYAPLAVPAHLAHPVAEPEQPFLTVMVRTQAQRTSTLMETLLSLAAQTVQDFEVLLLAHNVPQDEIGKLRDLVDLFDPEFAGRVRVVQVEGGGRAHPLNAATAAARGEYLAAIDDDDIAFGHWVEEFHRAARARPGRVVRSMVAEQTVESMQWGSEAGYEVIGALTCPFPEDFDLWMHLFENQSPFCGFAVPVACFSDMGVKFDETLAVVEDWDVLVQAALFCGVVNTKEVTSIYRRWHSPHSSLHQHSQDEWVRSRDKVLARLDQRTLPMPPGTLSDFHRMYHERNQLQGQIAELISERQEARLAAASALQEIDEIRHSGSWELTGPLRTLGSAVRRVLRGKG